MSLFTQTLDRAIQKCRTQDAVNGSVEDFFDMMVGKTKPQVEKIVREAKGNPNADKAYQKWKKIYTKDAKTGVHYITYIDVDGEKVREKIIGTPDAVNKRASDLRNHDCKVLKTEMFTNWKDSKPRRTGDAESETKELKWEVTSDIYTENFSPMFKDMIKTYGGKNVSVKRLSGGKQYSVTFTSSSTQSVGIMIMIESVYFKKWIKR